MIDWENVAQWGGHVTDAGSGVPSQRHEDDGGPS